MGKKSRVSGILILLLCSILLCSIYAFCVSGASILLTEVVSKDSNLDSKEPAFDISSGGVIHAVWVDETDLSDLSAGIASSDLSLSRNNGPDKDIFFNYRLNNTWSIQKLGSDSKMSGGVQVLSNESITSSIQPAIAFGPDNASHIVWSALSPPAELAADSNTLLLAHFNDANSLQNADYAAGAATVYSLGTEPANTKITKNALIKNALSLSGRGSSSYMNFSAVGNLDNTRGTIELWFNPLVDIQRKSSSDASVLLDLFNSTNASRGAALTLGGYNQNLITFSSYAAAYPTSASSSYSVSPSSYFYPFRANEWHHVAVTYDLSTLSASVFKLYIDGYLAGSSTQNLDRGFSFDTLCIGPCRPDQSFAADYRIDELMISDNVRSAAEIKMHAGNRSIFYRSVMNNTVESGQIMLTSGINLSYYPSITVDRSNNVHVVYNDVHNSTSLSVMYMVRNSTSWSEPELVSNGTSYAYMPDLSVDLNKTVHVVWEEFSPDDLNMSYIHHEQKNFSGTWHGEENVSDASYSSFAAHDVLGRTTLSSYFPKKPKIVTGSSNITKIVWVDNINYPDPDLLFYASFDKSTNATFSRGSGIVEQSAVSFKNSSRGSSYNKDFFYNGRSVDMANESPDISLSAHLNYSSASNLNINRGAISMWVRPFFNPSGADNTSNYLFASNYPDNLSSSLHLLISSGFGYLGSNYVQTAAVDNQTNPFAAAASVNVWAAGEWKHIGFSWDFNNETGSRELQLYMDGASMNISAQYPDNFIGPVRMNDPYGRFSIGTIFNATLGYINQTNGTIDELKIYNDTRTEAQFFGDMINDYDIFYREKNGSQWSDIIMVSNESDYMSLNPSITESGGKTYISWSQAQSDCDLNSQSFTNCAFFRIVAAMYNGTMNQLGAINDESMGGAFNPDITSSSGSIFYIWEDNSGLSGADTDIYFKKTASSAKPHVSVSEDIAGKVFTVEDPDAGLDVALAASASDVDSTVSNVTFYYTADSINGDKACTAYSDPYTCDWNIQGIAEDYYRIKAVVTSDDGGQDSDISDNYVYLDTTSGINTYFLNSSNEDNAVYYKGYRNWTDIERPNIDNGVLGSIGEGNCENDLSGLDGKYCSVSSPPFCEQGDYVNSLLSVFYLNESLSTIKSIDVYWKGRGYPATSYLTNLSVWSFAESKWIPVAYKDFTSDQDDILRYTITDNIKDYLQPQNNSIYILVETQDSHRLNSCPIPATVEIGSPCPFYQSWNGEEYIFETEGLLGLFSKQSESSTYDKLSHVKEGNGEIKIRVSEVLPEVLYLNDAKMISVDHPENTEAYIDFYGDPHTINRGKIASAICADSSGRDCSGLVLNADEIPAEPRSSIDGGLTSSRSNYDKPPVHYSGNAWVSDINSIDLEKDTNDYLYITLPPVPAADDAAIDGTTDSFTINSSSSGKTAKLIISGSETGLMSTSEFILFSLGKDVLPIVYDAIDNTAFGKIMNQRVVSSAKITLQIKDQEGRWIDYPYGPASDNAIMGAYETLVFPINLSLITDDEIRLKTTAFAYMIDFIGVDYSEDQIKDISYSEPGQPELMDRDDSRIAVKEGENLDISFKAPEKEIPAGYSRSYFLETSGYYHPLESLVMDRKEDYKSGIMDLAKAFASSPLYLLMYADSEYAKRYLIKRYLDSDFSGIAHDQGAISNFRNDIKGSLDSSADTSESGNPSVKHNTLYTDLIKVTVNTCTVLVNNLKVSSDTTLCRGKYHLVDSDYNDPSLMGIAQITGSNLAFDCDGSYISGGGEGIFGGQGSSGMAISINTADNVLIKNCNISGYKYGIGINNSVGTVIKDNEINYAEVGVGAQNSNNSLVYNNTVNFASSAAYSFAKGSVNNTLENNTALNNLLGFALETSHNNTIRNNIINASAWSFSYVGGIAVFTGSFYNKIDNNSLSNMILGLDLADAGISLTGTSHGFGGMWNNFSRNSIRHSYISSMGLMFPFPDDYFNYFERSNTADGENIYYYLNVHGTPSNYTQIRYLNLSVRDTSLFIGKITLVNCTYVNLSLNTLGNNFYNVVIVNSSNIIVQNNVLENATDTFSIYGNRGITAGVNLMAISSKDITIINNTAANGLFGYVFYNNSDRINFANNTARGNSQMGFYAYGLNNSYIQNNNISGNSIYGMYLYNMENSTINHNAFSSNQYGLALDHSLGQYTNNTISKNTIAGLYLYDHLGGAYLSGNMIENNTGAGISVTSSNKEVYSGLSTRNNSEAGIYVLDSSNITIVSPQSNKSRWGIKFSNSNNVHVTDAHTANNTDAEILFYNSLNNQIINSVIINKISAKDVNSSYNSDNYMLNTSFDRSNTAYSDDDGNAFSNLSVQWHLDFYVQSNESYVMGESIPVSGVNLSVSDSEGKNSQTVFTDSSGHSYFNVSEYRENSAGREYFSNYTWNLTKEGYSFSDNQIRPYITNTNMTENKFFNMSMAQQGGFNDTSPPSTPIVVDGPDYIDIDWFSSRSTLQASWYNSTDRLLVFYAFRIFDNGVCVPGYCAETDVGQNTSITINGLNLTEGHNYTFAVRARDSLFWFTPFEYSDGAIADFTAPTVAINSTTHPNQTEWYSNPNATFTFYGNDSLSGIKGFSYLLDDNPGTGPDLIADPRPPVILAEPKNNGYHRVLKTDGTGEAFAVFSQVRGNLSYGDNVAVSFQLSEDVSDRIDAMSVKAYLVRWGEAIDGYDNTDRRISTIAELTQDITHKDYSAADTYSVNLTVLSAAENYFYVAVAGLDADDNNTHNLSIAGTDSLTGIDNSTQALICGETSGCTNLTNTAEFAIGVRAETNSTIWTKSYANLANGMHWFHVRALDNAGNWGNPEHYAIQIDSVTGAPQFTTVKPRGYIATTNPTLVVETNEYAACYYNTSNSTHTGMTSYDGLHHESELSLSEGIYTYGLNCTDKSGNTAYNSTTFIINTSALPDMVSIWPMTNYTAGQKLAVNVNVTKAYGGVAYGLGELSSRFSANITGPDAVKTSVAISVTDKGGGLYSVSFTAPLTAGRYTLIVKVGNALDTETFAINSYSLTMRYAGVMDSAAVQENLVYWKSGSEYIIGLASDTVPVSITGTTSQLQLKYTAANGYGFIFMTDPFAIITNKQAYLSKGAFLDLKNPSFGHDTNEEEHVVSTILEYDDMQISGADNVYEGRYSLLIRNDGVNASSGKTKIKITIT